MSLISLNIETDIDKIPKNRRILIFVKYKGGWHTADWDEIIQEFRVGLNSYVTENCFHPSSVLAWSELPENLTMFNL